MVLPKMGGRLASSVEYKPRSYRNSKENLGEEVLLNMVTVSLESVYYIVGIASILCGAAYKLGYENGKHAKK